MKRHIGSSVALGIGFLVLAVGCSNLGKGDDSRNFTIMGPMIVIGALAYRSAKQRYLGEVTPTLLRRLSELLGIIIIVLMVVAHRNLNYYLATQPVVFLLTPFWAFVAYAIIAFRKPKAAPKAIDVPEPSKDAAS